MKFWRVLDDVVAEFAAGRGDGAVDDKPVQNRTLFGVEGNVHDDGEIVLDLRAHGQIQMARGEMGHSLHTSLAQLLELLIFRGKRGQFTVHLRLDGKRRGEQLGVTNGH